MGSYQETVKCTTELHGDVCRQTSTPHKGGNKMTRNPKKLWDILCPFGGLKTTVVYTGIYHQKNEFLGLCKSSFSNVFLHFFETNCVPMS